MYRDNETLSFELMGENYYAERDAAQDADERVTYPKWEEPLSAEEQAQIEAEEAELAAADAGPAHPAPAVESVEETRQEGFETSVTRQAQDARVQYTVTMTSEQYQVIYGAVLTAEIAFGAKAKTHPFDLAREFAAIDHAKAKAAMAVLDSLKYEQIEEAA